MPNELGRYFILTEVEDKSLLLKSWLLNDFLPKKTDQMEKFLKVNYSVQKPDQHYLIQVIKDNTNNNQSHWQM